MYVRQHIGVLLCLYSPLHLLDSDFLERNWCSAWVTTHSCDAQTQLWCLRVCCLSLILLLHA